MKLIYKAAVLTWALTALHSGLRADLVPLDYKTAGDSLLTFDSHTQLEWLDITATAGHVGTEAEALTSSGGPFAGFRLATDLEFKTLLADGGVPLTSASSNTALLNAAAHLQSLIGSVPRAISPPPGVPFIGLGNYTFGFLNMTEEGSPLGEGRLTTYYLANGQSWYSTDTYKATFIYPDPVIGLYLVRDSAVPESSSYGIASAVGLLGIVVWRRRIKTNKP